MTVKKPNDHARTPVKIPPADPQPLRLPALPSPFPGARWIAFLVSAVCFALAFLALFVVGPNLASIFALAVGLASAWLFLVFGRYS